ncbi:MAG: ABC transporter ATP-binding protein [Acidobacteria bacterium]|nr:MAG: ABC transporter ATP-binding protein [Acidobacteriota bacterium]
MIEVQHLTKRYGPVTAVDNISFRVEKGQILGLLGPNGAGKSTTMRILTGYMPATDGKAIVAGYDVFAKPIEAKSRIGYLPETPPLYPDMTVREYLTFVAKIKMKKTSKAERTARVDAVMKRTFVDDMAKRHCAKLSKGYRQRVGLAQALIHDPEVLVLDEPTAGLDPKQIIETRQIIKSLAGNHTVVLSTHILPEVVQTCQSVVILNKGKVMAVDTPDNLTRQLRGSSSLYVQVDAPGNDPVDTLAGVPGVTKVDIADRHEGFVGYELQTAPERDVRRDVARAVVDRGWGLLEMRPTRMSLEDIFLQLTTQEVKDEPKDATEVANA